VYSRRTVISATLSASCWSLSSGRPRVSWTWHCGFLNIFVKHILVAHTVCCFWSLILYASVSLRHPQILSPPARKQSLSTLGTSVVAATPTSGNFVQTQVWRVMLSLHLRLSICDDIILPLCCRQGHTTMDSEGYHAMLSCHRAPCGWVSCHDYFKKVIAREGLRAAGLNCAFEVPMLIPNSEKRPGDLFACLET
jgi:hypothetical protein